MEGDRIIKGIWFPIEIWEAEDLDWNEKILLMEIDSFTSKGMDCFMSNEYIAQFLKVSEWKAGQMVNDLIKKGYVIKTKFDGRRRYIESNVISSLLKDNKQPFEKQKADFGKSQANNINITKQDNTLSNKRAREVFTPPSVAEVAAYCRDRGNRISAEAFVAFYESNGWMVGKNRMKDWKAAIRTWEQRQGNDRPQQKPMSRQEEAFRHNMEILRQCQSYYQPQEDFPDEQ